MSIHIVSIALLLVTFACGKKEESSLTAKKATYSITVVDKKGMKSSAESLDIDSPDSGESEMRGNFYNEYYESLDETGKLSTLTVEWWDDPVSGEEFPTCSESAATTVIDSEKRPWGFEDGRSCRIGKVRGLAENRGDPSF